MLNLISCELLKLKRSKMVLISVAGVLSTPLLMLIEALQTHFDKPEIIFTLSDISVLVIKFLMNFIKKHDFKVFGWYRIVLGILVVLIKS